MSPKKTQKKGKKKSSFGVLGVGGVRVGEVKGGFFGGTTLFEPQFETIGDFCSYNLICVCLFLFFFFFLPTKFFF